MNFSRTEWEGLGSNKDITFSQVIKYLAIRSAVAFLCAGIQCVRIIQSQRFCTFSIINKSCNHLSSSPWTE